MNRTLLTLAAIASMSVALFAQDKKQNDWAQFYRYQKANEAILSGEKSRPTAVFMGNSITDMWAAQRPQFFEEHNFAGRGIGGQTSCEMLVRFQSDVIDLQPKYVVILSGTNDIGRNIGQITEEHIVQNIISMCELAKLHKIKPIICSVTPCKEFPWRKELKPADEIISLNNKLKAYAKKHNIKFVDYWSSLAAEDKGMIAEYTTDGCHITNAGYAIMEEIILKAL